MRILMVDLAREWRGGQSQALLLLRGLKTQGHAVELLAVGDSALAMKASEQHIDVHTISGSARRIRAAWALSRLLRTTKFDIVHVNEAHALTAAWLGGAHRRCRLVIARRVTFPLSSSHISLARYRAAACIVAVSQAVRDQLLAARIDLARIAVVRDGVEIPALVSAQERARARARWNVTPDEPVLAFVAALTVEKGHALLLEAFATLQTPEFRKQLPHCRLLLAGDGVLRTTLERQAATLHISKSVIFAGFVADVREIYAACDLFMFPPEEEGGGTSLLDAMACGLPVIASASGGIKEIVSDQENGLLLPTRTPHSMAAAATRLLIAPELGIRLGAAARETVTAQFSADRMVANTVAVFEHALLSSPRGKGRTDEPRAGH